MLLPADILFAILPASPMEALKGLLRTVKIILAWCFIYPDSLKSMRLPSGFDFIDC